MDRKRPSNLPLVPQNMTLQRLSNKPPPDLIKGAYYITLRYTALKVVTSGLLHSAHARLLVQYTRCTALRDEAGNRKKMTGEKRSFGD